MKILSFSHVKHTSRVTLILLTVKKIKCENFDFVLLSTTTSSSFFLSFFLSFFPSCITQKVYWVYEQSTHHTTALLLGIFLFLVKVACELRSTSYGPKYANRGGSTSFCAYIITRTTRKLKIVYGRFTYRTIALLSETSILVVRAVCEIRSASYGSKHALQPLSNMTFCEYLHALVTRKLQVVRGRSISICISNDCSIIWAVYFLC